MFKKLNLKSLLIIFIILLGLVLVIFYLDSKKGERSFRANIVDTDTSKVTSVIIYPRLNQEEPIEILKQGSSWKINYQDKLLNADNDIVKNMLKSLVDLKPKRIAATDKSKWKEFEVDDSLSTRVQLLTGKKIGTDLYIGKFSYQQPKGQMQNYYNQRGIITTCVRLADDKIVYVVDGYLSMAFNRNVNDYRNKSIIRSDNKNWTRLSFSYPADSSFTMVKENNKWMIGGLLADSSSVYKYFNTISQLNSRDFVDDQQPLMDKPVFTLRIEGDNIIKPIHIKAFMADTVHKQLITSSLNTGVYFSGSKSKLTEKIFVGKGRFFSSF
jgi:hypothetical protein